MKAYHEFVDERNLRCYSEFQEINDDVDIPAKQKVTEILKTWKQLGQAAPTAIITGDVFALPLLLEARNNGIRIPEDLSIIGIDNTSGCSLVDPQLTSIDESFAEMCNIGTNFLIRRMDNPKVPSICAQIAPKLILRQSVARLDDAPIAASIATDIVN